MMNYHTQTHQRKQTEMKNAIIAAIAILGILALVSMWFLSSGTPEEKSDRPRIHVSDFR